MRIEDARDITIGGNAFVLLATTSVHALGGAAQLTITGNTFSRYPFDPARLRKGDPGSGIVLEGTRDVTISGNTFTATREEAVKAIGEGIRRVSITGNAVIQASSEKPGALPAFVLENAANCIVADNTIHGQDEPAEGSAPAIRFQGTCEHNLVRGNVVTGYVVGIDASGATNQVESNIVP